jgi:uncharacterized protein YdhG (YjbR/CyaY superfamily)
MRTVEDYLKNATPAQRAEYERIRRIVKRLVPNAEEVISYGIPTFKYKGKYVLYFGAFKGHMSLFPGAHLTAVLREKLSGYKMAKGTIQFTEDHPIPDSVVEEIVSERLAEIKGSARR